MDGGLIKIIRPDLHHVASIDNQCIFERRDVVPKPILNTCSPRHRPAVAPLVRQRRCDGECRDQQRPNALL